MQHPRIVEVRKDKSCNTTDIGMNQIEIFRGKARLLLPASSSFLEEQATKAINGLNNALEKKEVKKNE